MPQLHIPTGIRTWYAIGVMMMVRFNLIVITAATMLAGCARSMYDPAFATDPYPAELHTTQTANMQVFRRDTNIEIVNATADSYRNFNLWINRRFVRHIESLPAGESITLSLWEFFDEHGDRFNAGGFFRAFEPTPVRLVQIQPLESEGDAPAKMVGLITIRREEIMLPATPGGR